MIDLMQKMEVRGFGGRIAVASDVAAAGVFQTLAEVDTVLVESSLVRSLLPSLDLLFVVLGGRRRQDHSPPLDGKVFHVKSVQDMLHHVSYYISKCD
jgi:hypothetical protein